MPDKLHVEYESTPDAWCAYYDPEGRVGRGKTREDAITELLDETDDAWRVALDELRDAKRSLSDYLNREWVTERGPPNDETWIVFEVSDGFSASYRIGLGMDNQGARRWFAFPQDTPK